MFLVFVRGGAKLDGCSQASQTVSPSINLSTSDIEGFAVPLPLNVLSLLTIVVPEVLIYIICGFNTHAKNLT